jgi:hypothetical protein
MEWCEVCGGDVKQGWDRRRGMDPKTEALIFFCSEKCQDKYFDKVWSEN